MEHITDLPPENKTTMTTNAATIWIGYIDIEQYKETEQEWRQLFSLVEPRAERDRISRYRQHVDAKRSCFGHLFMRYYLMRHLNTVSNNAAQMTSETETETVERVDEGSSGSSSDMKHIRHVQFGRTDKKKPYFLWYHKTTNSSQDNDAQQHKQQQKPEHNAIIDFNISHGGDIVLLGFVSIPVVHPAQIIGLDVERAQFRLSRFNHMNPYQEYLETMNSCFTVDEWSVILRPLLSMVPSDADPQLKTNTMLLKSIDSAPDHVRQCVVSNFFVFWTLKESFMKATGVGVEIELQRMQFEFETDDLARIGTEGSLIGLRPRLRLDGKILPGWNFESSLINSDHVASICLGPLDQRETAHVTSRHLRLCLTCHPSDTFSSRSATPPVWTTVNDRDGTTTTTSPLDATPFSTLIEQVPVSQVVNELCRQATS